MNLFHQVIVTFDKEAHLINEMTTQNEKEKSPLEEKQKREYDGLE